MNEADWIGEYKKRGALWIHDGNKERPHALCSSGKHSDGYFNSELVLEDVVLLSEAARDLMMLLQHEGLDTSEVDRIVGPAMGAIDLIHSLALQISWYYASPCLRAYTVKKGEGRDKEMVFERTNVRPNEHVLLGEDVLTTGGSVDLCACAVLGAGAVLVPFVAVLVNRSGLTEVHGKKIVALIDCPMQTWDSDECPLCKGGSEAIRPKEKGNWQLLNAEY